MDMIDLKILDTLKENSRISASDISKKINLSIPAVLERIRKMDESGLIEKYTVKINRDMADYKLLSYVFVNIDKTSNVENFREEIIKFKSVLECHHIAGQYDYLLKVLVKDTKSLETFITKDLKGIKGVSATNTIIVLSTLKEELNI